MCRGELVHVEPGEREGAQGISDNRHTPSDTQPSLSFRQKEKSRYEVVLQATPLPSLVKGVWHARPGSRLSTLVFKVRQTPVLTHSLTHHTSSGKPHFSSSSSAGRGGGGGGGGGQTVRKMMTLRDKGLTHKLNNTACFKD